MAFEAVHKGKKYFIFGLARSGLAIAQYLLARGASVQAWDDNQASVEKAQEQGINCIAYTGIDFTAIDALIVSPGVPTTFPEPHPVVKQAKAAQCLITSDVELFWRDHQEAKFIGVTGSNGKSTTTALIAHILHKAGFEYAVGGNIGVGVGSLKSLGKQGIYVFEMSSYQLDIIQDTVFDIALFSNISVDHLDRHGGMDGYVNAKRRIFKIDKRRSKQLSIIGIDDQYTQAVHAELLKDTELRTVTSVSTKGPADVHVDQAGNMHAFHGIKLNVQGLKTLQGEHNWQNIALAYAALRACGIEDSVFEAALQDYPGLIDRQEFVRRVGKVDYINDSKGTNPEATEKALKTYKNMYWLAGGRSKEGGYDILTPHLEHVNKAYLFGESAAEIAEYLSQHAVQFEQYDEMKDALFSAHEEAQAAATEAVVLMSNACSSFDQFPSYAARGEAFRQLVNTLS